MALNWKRVALDVLIIFGLTLVGGFIIGLVIGILGASGVGVTPSATTCAAAVTDQRLMVLALVVAPPVGITRR